jgi:DNA modification methylase
MDIEMKTPQTIERGEQTRQQSKFGFLSLDQVSPNASNPRKHSRAQVRAIATSIDAFGFNAPLLIDSNKQIIAGHGRFEAAKLLGLTHVPVISLEHLNPNQARAYMLADNKLTDRSVWDDTKLAVHLKDLSELALDFEIEATGFELPEIDFRVQSLDGSDTDIADEFEPVQGIATSKAGDLWVLGDHRLYCGSALDQGAYETLLGGNKVAAVFTDPPYNVRIDGHVSGNGAIKHREFAMAAGEMTQTEFTRFLSEMSQLLRDHSAEAAVIFICMDWRHLGEVLAAGRSAEFDLLNLCVWVKNNGGMGSFYRSRHELVFVFRNGQQSHLNNVQLGRHGRNRTNVWHFPGVNGFGRKGRKSDLELHPTVKPIALVADAILDCTKRNDIVLDPFMGSGTTLLAAERTNRRSYGIELDPLYVDTAIERWERLTRSQAKHVSGQSYEELRRQRSTIQ